TSKFDVQCSVFDVSSFSYERSEIRLPPIGKESRLHRRCGVIPEPWDRGQYQHFQFRQRAPAATSAGQGAGRIVAGLAAESEGWISISALRRVELPGLRLFPRPKPVVRHAGGVR